MINQLINNLNAPIGCKYLKNRNNLVFVEYGSGKISSLNINPNATVVSQGSTVIKGTWIFDCETGALEGNINGPGDIWWEQIDNVKRQMVPVGGARIINMGNADFAAITPFILQSLAYNKDPIPGNNDVTNQLVNNDVFAVRTKAGNFAKIRVVNYDYNMKIEWITYKLTSPYKVLGTGYTNPEDIAVSVDEKTAFVTERSGNLLRVDLNNADRSKAVVLISGLQAPHQIYLDEQHQQVYFVEYANPGRLIRYNLKTGQKTVLLNGLRNAVGLLISSDLSYAYISEQYGGGSITRFSLDGGVPLIIASGLTNPFFLTWMDSSQTAMFVAERDPANRITIVETLPRPGSVRQVVNGVGMRPSSVACLDSTQLLICCNTEIDKANLLDDTPSQTGLFKGIGYVPLNYITQQGLADTTQNMSYPYQFTVNSPFGGSLSLQVNHRLAWLKGARFYRVSVDGGIRLDTWTDLKLNTANKKYEILEKFMPENQQGYYKIRNPNDYYMNTDLGMIINSKSLENGLRNFKIEYFIDINGTPLKEGSNVVTDSHPIMINNEKCTASIEMPTVGDLSAQFQCGMYKFTDNAQLVKINYVASHPSNEYGTYSWRLGRAGVGPVPGCTECNFDDKVKPLPISFEKSVNALLGTCPSAAFYAHVYVYARIINGSSRQSQYDAGATIAFALTPAGGP